MLVVTEDHRSDQFIVRPVIERLLDDLGIRAQIQFEQAAEHRGVDRVLNADVLASIVEEWAWARLVLVVCDRDCDQQRSRSARVPDIEKRLGGKVTVGLAIEEIEVWMLALHTDKLPAGIRWGDVRHEWEECHPKERFAEPMLKSLGFGADMIGGRVALMRAIAGQWQGLLQRCPEIAELRDRIKARLEAAA